MDEALFGNDELIEKVSEYEDERGFSFIHTANIIESWVATNKDTLTAKEISNRIFSGDGIYAGRAIVNEKGFGHLSKEFKKQAMRDYFFMTIMMENCTKKAPQKPQQEKDKKRRGDQEDWGKPRWDGYEEDERKDEDGDDKK